MIKGFNISLEELQKILDYAKNRKEYDNMQSSIDFIIDTEKDNFTVKQYCCYAECNSIYHKQGKTEEYFNV